MSREHHGERRRTLEAAEAIARGGGGGGGGGGGAAAAAAEEDIDDVRAEGAHTDITHVHTGMVGDGGSGGGGTSRNVSGRRGQTVMAGDGEGDRDNPKP